MVGRGSRENLSGGETSLSSVDTEPKKQFHYAVSFGRLDPFGSRMSATKSRECESDRYLKRLMHVNLPGDTDNGLTRVRLCVSIGSFDSFWSDLLSRLSTGSVR